MNIQKSKYITMGIILFSLFFSGCESSAIKNDYLNDLSKGGIILNIDSPFNLTQKSSTVSRSIYPEDLDLTVASFEITGTGPDSSTISGTTVEESEVFTGMVYGEWQINVNAKNADGTIIGTGNTTLTLADDVPVNMTVVVDQVGGEGSLDLTINWSSEEIPSPSIDAVLTEISSGITRELVFNVETGTASFSDNSIPTGIYDLTLSVKTGTFLNWGYYDTPIIFNQEVSSKIYDLTSANSNYIPRPDITYISDNVFDLNWDILLESDLYNIYRATDEAGPYILLNETPVLDGYYQDNSVNALISYWYAIGIVRDSVELGLSPIVKSPLPPPVSLTSAISFNPINAVVSWSAATNADGYNIYRSSSETGTYEKLNSTLLTALSYSDDSVSSTTSEYYYKLESVYNGLGTSLSTVLFVPYDYPWKPLTSMLTNRYRFSSAVYEDKIYAFGGYSGTTSVQIYDTLANEWTLGESMSDSNYGTIAETVNGKIYVIGGYSSKNEVREYDPTTGNWTIKSPMPTARGYASSVVIGSQIYVLGGYSNLKTVEVYDTITDSWSTKASMNTSRYYASAAVVDGKIYVIGGQSSHSSIEEYDPSSDVWTIKTPMSSSLYGASAVVYNDEIYVCGGYSSGYTEEVRKYNPQSDTWTYTSASMNTARSYLAAEVVGSKIYTIGGNPAAVEVYDPLLELSK